MDHFHGDATRSKKIGLTPTAPPDYLVNEKPDWLPGTIEIGQMLHYVLLLQKMGKLMPQEGILMQDQVDACDEHSKKNLPHEYEQQIPSSDSYKLYRKRKRTISEYSLTDSIQEEVQVSSASKARIRKRKIKKVCSWTAWTVLFPVMAGLTIFREKSNKDDENDKCDDPMKPWAYDTKFVQPHKRL